MNNKIIYLDYAATTPLAQEVREQMLLGLDKLWANASSEHVLGESVHNRLDEAMDDLASFFQVDKETLTLTSGATESINLALKGIMRAQNKKHLIAITTEHKATLNTAQALIREGYNVTFLSPNNEGKITAKMFEDAITEETALITTLWVNNETGEIYDIEGISEVARKHDVLLHVDATQAMPHFKPDFSLVDLASITAHKIYGPKGIGLLYKRNFPRLPILPVLDGAKTELGNNTGTLANHQILGFVAAIKLLSLQYSFESTQNERRLKYLLDQLSPYGVTRNGKEDHLVDAIINIHIPYVFGETLMQSTPQLCFSRGSACNSDETLPSHVLTELGYSVKHARESVRISLGRFLLEFGFKRAVEELAKSIEDLQNIAKGNVCQNRLPIIFKKGRKNNFILTGNKDFKCTHEFHLERDDILLNFKLILKDGVVENFSVATQATPFLLWFMNELTYKIKGSAIVDWQNFKMNQVIETNEVPKQELRVMMVVEKFIRDSLRLVVI